MTMWANLTQTSFSNSTVITLNQAKVQCRVDTDDDDAYITSLISVAQASIDGKYGIGVALQPNTYRMSYDKFPWIGGMTIGIYPVISIDLITYLDMDGNLQTLDPSIYTYDLDANPVEVLRFYNAAFPTTLPTPGAIKINFTAGFQTVPADLVQAMLFIIGHMYENRCRYRQPRQPARASCRPRIRPQPLSRCGSWLMAMGGMYLPSPGTMRERVTFQTQVYTPDGAGGSSAQWTDKQVAGSPIGLVQARVTPVKGVEQLIAQGLQATFYYQIWIRSSSETQAILESDRCVWSTNNNILLDIISIQNPDEHNRFLLLLCERGVAQ
jgi:uncharacterized phiE125 gp8 family phage protein